MSAIAAKKLLRPNGGCLAPFVQIGDVIVSERFVIGDRGCDGAERVKVGFDKGYGWFSCKDVDRSRGRAAFVAVRAEMEDGGVAMWSDEYPDGWHVVAQRLDWDPGGTCAPEFDPAGEFIEFYQSGCFNCRVLPEDVKVIGHMDRVYAHFRETH